MAQGSQKTWGSEEPASCPDAAALHDHSVATARPNAAPPSTVRSDGEAENGDGAVVLDEANDLLVINEAGTLLPATEGSWADPVVAGPAKLSRSAASWAKQVLATETESTQAENEGTSTLTKDPIQRDGGEDTSQLTVDWIDW